MTFEEGYSRLEKILAKLSSDEVALEESITLFEEANKLIAKCNATLSNAEQKIEKLIAIKDGKPVVEPFTPPTDHILN